MSKTRKQQSTAPLAIVGRALSRDATMLARVAAPADAEAALAVAKALRDPERVARLVDGLIKPATTTNNAAA